MKAWAWRFRACVEDLSPEQAALLLSVGGADRATRQRTVKPSANFLGEIARQNRMTDLAAIREPLR